MADLRRKFDGRSVPIMSLFFNYKNDVRQSISSVLRSLLRQLISSQEPVKIPHDVHEEWERARFSGKRPLDENQAREILQKELRHFTHKFLVIDALDEAKGCGDRINDEIHWLRQEGVCIFSTELSDPRTKNYISHCYRHQGPQEAWELYWQCKHCDGFLGNGIEICHDCFVNKGLRCDDPTHTLQPPLRVHIEVRASIPDMHCFAEQFLDEGSTGGDVGDDDTMFSGTMTLLGMLRADIGADKWNELPSKIAEAADGNFLHAKLFLERLKEQRHTHGANSLLRQLQHGSLPDIDGQYREKLAMCLNGPGAQVARDHLTIVSAAKDVLRYDQLSHAAAISSGNRSLSDFIDRCCRMEVVRHDTAGLLSIDSAWYMDAFLVGFSHRTFPVFINESPDNPFPDAQQKIFDACLSYLGLEAFDRPFETSFQLDETLRKFPLASYAACYWGLHAKQVGQTAANTLRISEFLNDAERLNCAMQIAWRSPSSQMSTWDVSGGVTPLHVCAFFGLDVLSAGLIDAGTLVDPVEGAFNQTPLIYACRQGHLAIVKLLLQAGASPNHLTKHGRSPLLEAIEFGHEDVFELLMTQDRIDVNLKGTRKPDQTPLIAAAEWGRESMMEKLLAHKRILVNEPDGWNCTALSRAVQSLQIGCVSQLLAHDDTDLTMRDNLGGRTALDWLAGETLHYEQDSDMIHTLAAMLMDDHRAPLPSDNAVVMAIKLGRLELLRIFVRKSLHHLYKDDFGRSFLHLAATEGVCAIVTLFHDHLANEASFNINALDNYKATALHAVCSNLRNTSHVETIEFLLNAGADPTLEDVQGFTPLKRARRASQELWDSHVKALFASSNAAILDSDDGPATLEMALRAAKFDAFKTALDQLPDPIDPETAHYSGSTILHHAMELKDESRRQVLPLLLPKSHSFLSDVDSEGQSCAHIAVRQNSLDSLKSLCAEGISLDLRDKWGLTAFELAHRWRRLDLCVYLITQGAELSSGREIHPSLLHAAVESGELAAVERLIQAGVDVNYRDSITGQTNVQHAEELKEKAAEDSKHELWAKDALRTIKSEAEWEVRKYGAPEVVRRDGVLQFLRETQEKNATPQVSRVKPDQGVTRLIAKLKGFEADQVLSVSDFAAGSPISDTPRRVPAPTPNLVSLTFNVGSGVVVIAVAVVAGMVTVAIAWIISHPE